MHIKSDQEYLEVFRLRQKLLRSVDSDDDWGLDGGEAAHLDRVLRSALDEYEDDKGDETRQGHWIPTVSGRRFWLGDPRPEDIEPFDIAYGLSRIPRFNGMTVGDPYSVAQHSTVGSFLAPPGFALHFLLHDAHEFLGQDITSPLKRELGPEYRRVEEGFKDAVDRRFGLAWTEEAKRVVKDVDNQMLLLEIEELTPWRVLNGHVSATRPRLRLQPQKWQMAFVSFSWRLNALLDCEAIKIPDDIREAAGVR
jgi:hypothetical protein